MFDAFECSKEWFNGFKTFENFCRQFKLCGSFVDEKFNVIKMEKLFPILPQSYELYIYNVCNAVKLRNNMLEKIL